jgi:hypothetical protein
MSINSDDLVGALLDHQARVNFALDDGDINSVIEDLFLLPSSGTEPIGTATDVTKTSATNWPHKYDDAQSPYDFCSWA